jgi:NAD(P)-dependent dehydrogenase (short-subunit alcohol dehydrogenase family)
MSDERQGMKELAGKVTVITGAASGIGLATVRALGREGMKVVMADVNETRLQEAADACLADGLTVHPVATDVSDFNAVRHLADVSYDTFGAVHVLHLNAGVAGGTASLFDEDTSSWHQVLGVNLLGVVWGIKAFLPRMKEANEEAVILATSSGAGAEGTAFRSTAYAATKLAVVSVMESLYGILQADQSPIRAGVVFPPLTATRLSGDPANMKSVEQLLQSQGVPAVLVEPEPVAEMILDGIKRNRFFIRMGTEENKKIFNGSQPPEHFDWNARMIRGRAEAQLADATPDEYLW